jgi:hypothetical protein
MKDTYSFIVYTKEAPKRFKGILGEIDLYAIQFLLVGGNYIIEESYSGTTPIEWYKNILEQQDIVISQSKQQKYKGQTFIWMEVDTQKTPISEFTSWKDLDPADNESLAWRTFFYTCYAGTTKECLGLAITAHEIPLQTKKQSISLHTVLDAILSS